MAEVAVDATFLRNLREHFRLKLVSDGHELLILQSPRDFPIVPVSRVVNSP